MRRLTAKLADLQLDRQLLEFKAAQLSEALPQLMVEQDQVGGW